MSRGDRERFDIPESGTARLTTAAGDGITRSMTGFQVIDHDIPAGTCPAYYPECNPLNPLWQHAKGSETPAAKSVPVRVERE